jgi:hypothetical protein
MRAELIEYGRTVIEEHSDLCLSDLHEQLDAHFESQYPEAAQMLVHGVIEELMDDLYNERSARDDRPVRAWNE